MISKLRRIWDAVLSAGAFVGIIYMPADIFGLSEAYPWIARVVETTDRFTVLAAFTALLILYIFWMDIRPLVRRWLSMPPRKEQKLRMARAWIRLSEDIFSELSGAGRSYEFRTGNDHQDWLLSRDEESRHREEAMAKLKRQFSSRIAQAGAQLDNLGLLGEKGWERHSFNSTTNLHCFEFSAQTLAAKGRKILDNLGEAD